METLDDVTALDPDEDDLLASDDDSDLDEESQEERPGDSRCGVRSKPG